MDMKLSMDNLRDMYWICYLGNISTMTERVSSFHNRLHILTKPMIWQLKAWNERFEDVAWLCASQDYQRLKLAKYKTEPVLVNSRKVKEVLMFTAIKCKVVVMPKVNEENKERA